MCGVFVPVSASVSVFVSVDVKHSGRDPGRCPGRGARPTPKNQGNPGRPKVQRKWYVLDPSVNFFGRFGTGVLLRVPGGGSQEGAREVRKCKETGSLMR